MQTKYKHTRAVLSMCNLQPRLQHHGLARYVVQALCPGNDVDVVYVGQEFALTHAPFFDEAARQIRVRR